jgi:hypothetical protein
MTRASNHAGLALPKGQSRSKAAAGRATRLATHELYTVVFARDQGQCRVPWCRTPWGAIEMAHLVPKSVGGASSTANCAMVCVPHHRGPINSLHAGTLEVTLVTDDGADGALRFSMQSWPEQQT